MRVSLIISISALLVSGLSAGLLNDDVQGYPQPYDRKPGNKYNGAVISANSNANANASSNVTANVNNPKGPVAINANSNANASANSDVDVNQWGDDYYGKPKRYPQGRRPQNYIPEPNFSASNNGAQYNANLGNPSQYKQGNGVLNYNSQPFYYQGLSNISSGKGSGKVTNTSMINNVNNNSGMNLNGGINSVAMVNPSAGKPQGPYYRPNVRPQAPGFPVGSGLEPNA